MSRIELKHIDKFYGSNHVLRDINLTIEDGDFMTLLGPSGCGKTTTLRVVSGLEKPQNGIMTIDGVEMINADDAYYAEPSKRGLNLVFQSYALWPHMTVFDNVAFGLKIRKESSDVIAKKVASALERMQIGEYAKRYPTELSGGQQQRVAIARTLAPEPTVLFMDEPLSNLDAKLRLEMRYELQRLHVETDSTFVYVTHDQMEAMTLATQICLINNGVLQQYEAPLDVYHHPANLFVADFVGNPSINFVEVKGRQAADGSVSMTMLGGVQAVFRPKKPVELAAWFEARDREEAEQAAALREKAKEKGYVEKGNKDEVFRYHIAKVDEEDDSLQDAPEITNEDLVLGIRPEFLDIADSSDLRGEIYGAMPTGMESTIKVRVGGFLLTGVIFGSSLFTIGTEVPLSVTGDQIMLFDRKSGRCITSGSLTF